MLYLWCGIFLSGKKKQHVGLKFSSDVESSDTGASPHAHVYLVWARALTLLAWSDLGRFENALLVI